MATFKIFTSCLFGKHNLRSVLSLCSVNDLMRSHGLPTFLSWNALRNFVLHHFSDRFNERNYADISLHSFYEAFGVRDPRTFTHCCVIFRIYDL